MRCTTVNRSSANLRIWYPLLFSFLASFAVPEVKANPIAYSFCYPISPIGPSGGSQIVCPVDGDISPVQTTHYVNRQPFLDFNPVVGGGQYHLGEDWNGNLGGDTDYGDPVYAVADGVVTFVEDRASPDGQPHSWGKVVVIKHFLPGGGVVYSLYGHLAYWTVSTICHSSSSPLCVVHQGDQIGAIGDGNGYYAGAAHLHLEMRKVFVFNDPSIIPGPAYTVDPNSPFVEQNYYHPTEFIEDRRGGSCVVPNQSESGEIAASCSSAPAVTTVSATSVTQTAATLNLSVNPNGAETTVWFDWGTSQSLGSETLRKSVGQGTFSIPASITLDGLPVIPITSSAPEPRTAPARPCPARSFPSGRTHAGAADPMTSNW